jgi:hypothetical protein
MHNHTVMRRLGLTARHLLVLLLLLRRILGEIRRLLARVGETWML